MVKILGFTPIWNRSASRSSNPESAPAKGDLYEGYVGDFRENQFSKIIHKWGEDDDLVELQKLYDVINDSNPIDAEALEALIDLDSFITLWASEVLIGHWDGYSGNRNNWYAFRGRESGKFTFIPWGADSVFHDPGPSILWPVPKSVKAKGIICQKLWELPEIRVRYRKEMQRLLDDVWNEEGMLEQLQRIQKSAQDQDYVRPGHVAAGFASIREFIDTRRGEIQIELDGPAPDWPLPPRQQEQAALSGPPTMMRISGSFSAIMQSSLPARENENEVSLDLDLNVPFDEGEASLGCNIDDESHAPFVRYGVQAFPDSPFTVRPGYPSIQIRAGGENGEPTWRLTMMLDPFQLKPADNELPSDMFSVWTVVSQGEFGTENFQGRFFGVEGKINIDEFSMEPGSTISGSFEVQAPAFAGRE